MAKDWMPVELSTPNKPEVFEISGTLGLDPDTVVGKLIRVWAWFDEYTEDGNTFVTVEALLDSIVRVTGFCKAMEKVGWLDFDGETLSMPNFERHNGRGAKKRLNTQVRVASHRKRNAKSVTKGNTLSVTKSVTTEQNRTEQYNTPIVPKGTGREIAVSDGSESTVELHPLHERLIRCITPNSKCDRARDTAEVRAWRKVRTSVTEADVVVLEWFYGRPKAEKCDATWKRKTGVAQLLNQLTEQVELAEELKTQPSGTKRHGGEPSRFESA